MIEQCPPYQAESSMPLPTAEKRTVIIMPEIQLGHTHIRVDNQKFIEGIDTGIEAYCECYSDETEIRAQVLLDWLMEVITSDPRLRTRKYVLGQWRLGFLVGLVIGLLNPDVADDDPALGYLESISLKSKKLYG